MVYPGPDERDHSCHTSRRHCLHGDAKRARPRTDPRVRRHRAMALREDVRRRSGAPTSARGSASTMARGACALKRARATQDWTRSSRGGAQRDGPSSLPGTQDPWRSHRPRTRGGTRNCRRPSARSASRRSGGRASARIRRGLRNAVSSSSTSATARPSASGDVSVSSPSSSAAVASRPAWCQVAIQGER